MTKANNYKDLMLIRDSFPATTSAAHTLMMQAQELHRSRQQNNWVELDGQNLSKLRFERSVAHVLSCAREETGKEDPGELLTFVNRFLGWLSAVTYGFESAYREIKNRRLKVNEIPRILAAQPQTDPSRYAPAV